MDFILRSIANNTTITIRQFVVPDDARLVFQWTAHSLGGWLWEKQPPIDEIIQVFKSIAESDIVSAYIVEANDTPLFEIDIRLADIDPASAYFATRPDDYSINLLLPPEPDLTTSLTGLSTCIEYFFLKMNRKVNRIIAPVYNHDIFLHELLERAGFERVKLIREGNIHEIYGLSKHSFTVRKQSQRED